MRRNKQIGKPKDPTELSIVITQPEPFEDYRVSNPKLHELYVRWGMHHLKAFEECIEKLKGFSDGNLLGALQALCQQRRKLIDTQAAYQEAAWKLYAGWDLPPYN